MIENRFGRGKTRSYWRGGHTLPLEGVASGELAIPGCKHVKTNGLRFGNRRASPKPFFGAPVKGCVRVWRAQCHPLTGWGDCRYRKAVSWRLACHASNKGNA
jgi:hypothetical protein